MKAYYVQIIVLSISEQIILCNANHLVRQELLSPFYIQLGEINLPRVQLGLEPRSFCLQMPLIFPKECTTLVSPTDRYSRTTASPVPQCPEQEWVLLGCGIKRIPLWGKSVGDSS